LAGADVLFTGIPRMNINPMVVDLYHGDTVESFPAAKQFGIRGVIHKATEGLAYVDSAYAGRRAKAVEAALLWGAYHFMRPGDPMAQADHFVDTAEPLPDTLVALDHEDPKVPLADAVKFMRTVESRVGRKVVLYSGFLIKAQLASARIAERIFLGDRRLWLAHYNAKPTWPYWWESPWLWQFTGDGVGPPPHSVPGLQDKLDVNSFAGTADELAAQWAGEILAPAVA
jgi:lysozyme